MQTAALQLETLDTLSLIKYIKELEERFNRQIWELTNENLLLKEECAIAKYKQYARSSEQFKLDPNQKLLFDEESVNKNTKGPVDDIEYKEVKSYKRRKCGRKPIDPNLPREDVIIDIDESEKTCGCGTKLTKIGEETSEKIEYEPQKIKVKRFIRPKYACRHCEGTEDEEKQTVRIAAVPPSIIPKGIATPSLASHIIINKFEDHLPYNRQEKVFKRIKIAISRQDMSNWQQYIYAKIKPVFDLLKKAVKKGPVTKMDETTTQVMGEKDRKDTQLSYMWLVRGGLPEEPVALYEYRETRSAYNVKEILEGYKGFLQTDGYEAYDSALKGNKDIIHAGCFAHARRHFIEAIEISSQAEAAKTGVQFIKKLYEIESKLRERYKKEKYEKYSDEEKRKIFLRVRQLCVYDPLKKFKEWLLKVKDEYPPSLKFGKAVNYSLSQWDKLVVYLQSPYLTPDNNESERLIRPFVLGRGNWLFSKSPGGAESSCGMYTLIQTAKLNGLNPQEYLQALFEKAPEVSSPEGWEKLLPWNIFKN